MVTFLPFLDIVLLTYAVFLSQRDLGPAVTFACKHCQACQEAWVDHAQITLRSGKGHTSNSHTAMNQLHTKLLLVKPNEICDILCLYIIFFKYFHNITYSKCDNKERDTQFEVFQRHGFFLQMEQELFRFSLHLFPDRFFTVTDKQGHRQGKKMKDL